MVPFSGVEIVVISKRVITCRRILTRITEFFIFFIQVISSQGSTAIS